MKNLSAMFVALSLAGATPFIPMGGGTAYAQTQASSNVALVDEYEEGVENRIKETVETADESCCER